MENYYSLLGISYNASAQDVKRAFREKAKLIHPDIAGDSAEANMRKLLTAYEVLSDQERRYEYDRIYRKLIQKVGFDYRKFLQDQDDDPQCQAKLVFFDLLHLNEESAVALWRKNGGVDFRLEKYFDREDWMDCTFILAEELQKRNYYYEAFVLLVSLVRSERQKPYFKHFMSDLEGTLKELVRVKLKAAVDNETYISCMKMLIGLGFSKRDEAKWMRSMAEALLQAGDKHKAQEILQEALTRDPRLSNTVTLKRKLAMG